MLTLLNEIKRGFTDTLFVLETTHMKFCLLDQIVVAASLADTVLLFLVVVAATMAMLAH